MATIVYANETEIAIALLIIIGSSRGASCKHLLDGLSFDGVAAAFLLAGHVEESTASLLSADVPECHSVEMLCFFHAVFSD